MEKGNSNQQNSQKKIVKRVVRKSTAESNTNTSSNGQQKKVVKKVVKRVIKKNVQNTQNTTVNSQSKKTINYKEEIEKLSPTNKEQGDRNINSENKKNNNQLNENAVIIAATDAEQKQEEKKKGKRIIRKKTRLERMFRKYGVLLVLFFTFSIIYFGWMYLVPAVLNFKITTTDVNDFLQPKIGFKIDYTNSVYYTTPDLAVGVRLKNLKLVYPEGRLDDDKMLFLRARQAIFEVPVIPFLMKTIKFNEFSLRSVNANLYQDKNGKYVYLEQFKKNFNPNAKKYLLEVPDITILSYNMPSFNEQSHTFTKKSGAKMRIPAKAVKEAIKSAPKSNTIMLR